MAFQVIPALDIARGRLVRVSSDGSVPIPAFGGDPVAAAGAFVEAGATRLHVVDVDLAETGRAGDLDTLRSIAALGVPVQASGGVTTSEQADALLAAGSDRVVVGAAVLADRDGGARLLEHLGERACVGIEADGPTIRPRGRAIELPLWDTLTWLGELDVRRYVFTEIARSGRLSGPDLDGIWALATHTGTPVIAAGGIRSVEDLQEIARLGGMVEGAIVGRAFHEGLDFRAALSVGR